MGRAAAARAGTGAKRTGTSRSKTSNSKASNSKASNSKASNSKASNGKAPSLEELQRERLELRDKLAAAEARIAVLEGQRVDALNRIDWVIDSIQNVLERP